jgi:uncharacterized protein HemY
MRSIKIVEDKYLAELARLYGCDELDVPVDLDVLALVNKSSSQRRTEVERLLKDAPKGKNEIVNNLLKDLSVSIANYCFE